MSNYYGGRGRGTGMGYGSSTYPDTNRGTLETGPGLRSSYEQRGYYEDSQEYDRSGCRDFQRSDYGGPGRGCPTNIYGRPGPGLSRPNITNEYGRPITTNQYGRPITTNQYGRPITTNEYGRPITTNEYGRSIARESDYVRDKDRDRGYGRSDSEYGSDYRHEHSGRYPANLYQDYSAQANHQYNVRDRRQSSPPPRVESYHPGAPEYVVDHYNISHRATCTATSATADPPISLAPPPPVTMTPRSRLGIKEIGNGQTKLSIARPAFLEALGKHRYLQDTRIVCRGGECWTNKLILFHSAPTIGLLFNDQLPGEVTTILMPDYPVEVVQTFIDLASNGAVNIRESLRLEVVRLMYSLGWSNPVITVTDLEGNPITLDAEGNAIIPPRPQRPSEPSKPTELPMASEIPDEARRTETFTASETGPPPPPILSQYAPSNSPRLPSPEISRKTVLRNPCAQRTNQSEDSQEHSQDKQQDSVKETDPVTISHEEETSAAPGVESSSVRPSLDHILRQFHEDTAITAQEKDIMELIRTEYTSTPANTAETLMEPQSANEKDIVTDKIVIPDPVEAIEASSDDEVQIVPVEPKQPNVLYTIDLDSDLEEEEPSSTVQKSPHRSPSPRKISPQRRIEVPIRNGWFMLAGVKPPTATARIGPQSYNGVPLNSILNSPSTASSTSVENERDESSEESDEFPACIDVVISRETGQVVSRSGGRATRGNATIQGADRVGAKAPESSKSDDNTNVPNLTLISQQQNDKVDNSGQSGEVVRSDPVIATEKVVNPPVRAIRRSRCEAPTIVANDQGTSVGPQKEGQSTGLMQNNSKSNNQSYSTDDVGRINSNEGSDNSNQLKGNWNLEEMERVALEGLHKLVAETANTKRRLSEGDGRPNLEQGLTKKSRIQAEPESGNETNPSTSTPYMTRVRSLQRPEPSIRTRTRSVAASLMSVEGHTNGNILTSTSTSIEHDAPRASGAEALTNETELNQGTPNNADGNEAMISIPDSPETSGSGRRTKRNRSRPRRFE